MRKLTAALLATSLIAFAACAAAAECRYSAPRNADIDAAGLHDLIVKNGSADLDIEGVQGLNRVEVRGTACASDQSWLKNLQLGSSRRGEHAAIAVVSNDIHTFQLFGISYAYLKLHVRVPASLAIIVDSGSGDTQARALASLDYDSGSGDLIADNIAGALKLQLGSADVRVNQVGSVNLRGTGSGNVRVDGVTGDVQADHAGSGDLAFSGVRGGVQIGSTGSGDIILRDIGRDVEVGRTGSGDVTANDVGGNFTVRATGSGDVNYHGVKGKVSVPHSDDGD